MMAKQWTDLLDLTREEMVDNILLTYHQSTEGEREYGESWYRVAHNAAARIGKSTGHTTRTVAAVISALSPSNEWHRNLVEAEEFCKAAARGDKDRPTASTYGPNADKAWAILTRGDYDDEEEYFLTGRAFKTHAFFVSIAEPWENHGTVVVDGHAFNIAHGVRVPLSEVPNLGAKGRYYPVAHAYVAAAQELDITPQALQATCWIVWRRRQQLSLDDLLLTTDRI